MMKQEGFRYRWLGIVLELALVVAAAVGMLRRVFIASGGKSSRVTAATPGDEAIPNIALCYARESFSRYAAEAEGEAAQPVKGKGAAKGRRDSVSLDRQQQNCEAAARRHGYRIEWYVEAVGHRSGRDLRQRPKMQQLLTRVGQPGVRALVVNDLARLFRRGWRMGQLLEVLQQHGIKLILAAPGRELDLATPEGKMIAAFMSMVDEWYIEDVRQRTLDYQRWRREQGLTLGLPPCGAIRHNGKALIPSPFGAWLLADGSVMAGYRDDVPPQPDALWRGYYDAVRATLDLYSQNEMGLKRIARELRRMGWFYRANMGAPKPPRMDDVRRVIAAWPQYAGLVVVGASKNRRKGDIPLDWTSTGHSIFDESLLRQVARVEQERRRTRTQRATGSKGAAYPYPVRGLVVCAQCGEAKLSGTDKHGKRAYRHAQQRDCSTSVRSVPARNLEEAVLDLVGRLQFAPEVEALLGAAQVSWVQAQANLAREHEAQRRMSLYRIQRQLVALNVELEVGATTEYAYRQRRAALLLRQAEALQPSITPADLDLEMTHYLEAVCAPIQLWKQASPPERQTLMALLFEAIWYDLEAQRITDFRLQPWAQRVFVIAE